MVEIKIPQQGDIIFINFDPKMGHEQGGFRPAIVISPFSYNNRTGMAIVCPITKKIKNYAFEFPINNKKINGVVILDQIRSIDWKTRKIKIVERITKKEFIKAIEILKMFLEVRDYSA